jgi:hypothetical protein
MPEPDYGGPRDSTDPLVRRRRAQADATAQAERASGSALVFHGDGSLANSRRRLGWLLRAPRNDRHGGRWPGTCRQHLRDGRPPHPVGWTGHTRTYQR